MDTNLEKIGSRPSTFPGISHTQNPTKLEKTKSPAINLSEKSLKRTKKTNEYATVHLPQNAHKTECKSISIHSFVRVPKNSGFELIAKSSKLFRKHVEFQKKQIETEVALSRETKRAKDHWQNLKDTFHRRLNQINMARQQKH